MAIIAGEISRGGDSHHELLPGVFIPKEVLLNAVNEPGIQLDVRMTVHYSEHRRRYVVDVAEVVARDGGEVSNMTLRRLTIQDYLRRGLEGLPTMPSVRPSVEEGERLRELGPSSAEALAAVAQVYALAEAFNLQPAKQVQEAFGMPAPTASTWIRRARDLRFLPAANPIPSPSDLDRNLDRMREIAARLRGDDIS